MTQHSIIITDGIVVIVSTDYMREMTDPGTLEIKANSKKQFLKISEKVLICVPINTFLRNERF